MNKRAKITFFSILLIAIVLLVCSFFVSNSSPKRIDHTGFYMDTFVNETIYGKDTTEVLLCPHGRPIVVEVTQKQIEKWFKRIV